MSNKPRVSIGLPVFNGENFIIEALDSILTQTYSDYELIISDNGSTDGTEAICRAYAARDERIRYYRSDENRGAAWNYNRVFHLSSGEYFKWAAHDDVCAPTLIENCANVLDNNPDVVLCFTWLDDIDEQGNTMRTRQAVTNSDYTRPHKRFRVLCQVRPAYTCEEVFGLIRTDVLKRTRLIADYSDSDRTLLAELSLYGPFYEIPEVLFFHRLHAGSSVAATPSRQERTVWFNPAAKGHIVFPNWRQFAELMSVIWHSPIPWVERLHCYFHMLNWIKRSRKRLRKDLSWAVKQFRLSYFSRA